jgi:hypothetical protein
VGLSSGELTQLQQLSFSHSSPVEWPLKAFALLEALLGRIGYSLGEAASSHTPAKPPVAMGLCSSKPVDGDREPSCCKFSDAVYQARSQAKSRLEGKGATPAPCDGKAGAVVDTLAKVGARNFCGGAARFWILMPWVWNSTAIHAPEVTPMSSTGRQLCCHAA